MRKISLSVILACGLLWACGPKHSDSESRTFTYEVVESQNFPNLPALQSFAFAQTDSCWLFLGGRTNGFHGFGGQENFPVRKANLYAYAYNFDRGRLDSLSVDSLPDALKWQFRSTNMQHVQDSNYLYLCGGYGARIDGGDTAWVTNSVFSRIDVALMVDAIQTGNYNNFRQSVVYDENRIAQSTGGELFKLNNGEFFLVLGHNFTGKYNAATATQVYLDSVRVFTISETANSVKINTNSFRYISDGLPDTTTQFRRRDLVVAPLIYGQGNKVGVSVYGGVFTYSSGTIDDGGNPFRWPIYIPADASESYTLDKNYEQLSNIYSAPNLALYSKANDMMYTSIFGGLGDTANVNGDNAAFTKFITTIVRNYGNDRTTTQYNPTTLPHYVGSEGLFILARNLPLYNNSAKLNIVNLDSLQGRTLVGHIYGGIHSDSTQWNNTPPQPINLTKASRRVYDVYINFQETVKKK